MRWCLSLIAIGLVVAAWATPSFAADNTLVSATPAAGTTVDVSPASLSLVFATQVGPSPQVTMSCGDPGQVQSLGQPLLLQDQLTVSVALLSPAPKGTCTVSWRVTDTNLQPAGSNSYSFEIANDTVATVATTTTTIAGAVPDSTVATTAPVTTAPSTDTGDGSTSDTSSSSGPLGLFRLLSNLGLAMVFGALVVIVVAWPEGVEYIVTVRHLRFAWIIAVVSTGLFAAALEASQTGNGLGASLSPTSWGDLLDTTSGKAALVRLLFILATAYVIMRPERVIDPSTQIGALVPPGIAVVTMAFSRDEFGLIEYASGAVHAIAMAVWLGGLILLTRVVLAGPGDEDLVHAVRGFARISNAAIVATLASGAILLFRLDRGALGTSHGLVLILKTVLVLLVMVPVGVAARQFINQRVSRVDTMTAPLAHRLRRALGIEAGVGIVVLVLTAWLLALTPAGLTAGGGSSLDLGASHRFVNTSLNADVSVAFSERVGANDVRIEVVEPATGLSGLTVDFLPPVGSAANGMTINPIPLTGAGVAVLEKSDGFTLTAAGTWTVIVSINGTEVARQDVFVTGGSTDTLAPATGT